MKTNNTLFNIFLNRFWISFANYLYQIIVIMNTRQKKVKNELVLNVLDQKQISAITFILGTFLSSIHELV